MCFVGMPTGFLKQGNYGWEKTEMHLVILVGVDHILLLFEV